MAAHYYLKFIIQKAWRPIIPIFTGTLLAVFLFRSLISLPDGRLHLKFYDVGQGDAVFIRTPSGNQILIDGGPDSRILPKLYADMPFFDRTIELVILTHPHADHVSGLVEVLRRFKVEHIIYGPDDYDSNVYRQFISQTKEQVRRGAAVHHLGGGERISLGEVSLEMLWPPLESTASDTTSNPNNLSLVGELRFKGFKALLPGDQETDEAARMLSRLPLSPVEVLKVAHHGSKNGLNREALEILKPQLAVISVGANNKYGHPHQQTLDLLRSLAIPNRRTDVDGTVEVVSDGEKFWLRR